MINPKVTTNNPHGDNLSSLDGCHATFTPDENVPGGGLLGPDNKLAPQPFLHSDVKDSTAEDLAKVYLHLPYDDTTNTQVAENDGRLTDFLRANARSRDPKLVLANAVSLWLGGGSTALPWDGGTIDVPPKTKPRSVRSRPGDRRGPASCHRPCDVQGVRRLGAAGRRPVD